MGDTKVKDMSNAAAPGALTGWVEKPKAGLGRVRDFFHDVRMELRHVTWPSWNDVRATTLVVIVTVFFFGLYFWLVDNGIQRVVEFIFTKFKP